MKTHGTALVAQRQRSEVLSRIEGLEERLEEPKRRTDRDPIDELDELDHELVKLIALAAGLESRTTSDERDGRDDGLIAAVDHLEATMTATLAEFGEEVAASGRDLQTLAHILRAEAALVGSTPGFVSSAEREACSP